MNDASFISEYDGADTGKGGEEDGKGRLTRNRRKRRVEKRPKKFRTKRKSEGQTRKSSRFMKPGLQLKHSIWTVLESACFCKSIICLIFVDPAVSLTCFGSFRGVTSKHTVRAQRV